MKVLRALVLAAVCACTEVEVAALPTLSRFDVMTVDPSILAVAVEREAGLSLRTGAAMTLSATVPSGTSLSETFDLEKTGQRLPADGPADILRETFRIAPADIGRFNALRSQIQTLKAAEGDGVRGSMAVTASGCREGDLPDRPLKVDVLLQFEKDGGFFPVLNDVDLRELVTKAGYEDGIGPCSG